MESIQKIDSILIPHHFAETPIWIQEEGKVLYTQISIKVGTGDRRGCFG